ncbi:MAG: hypothetical protein E3J64_06925 [Anaerolineales bacterium]|nr:MAG: hypothetical protein E3J64_06925 [Anaerolineales bacterium]
MIEAGQVLSNSSAYGGGGLFVWQGSATLSGGEIVGNTASRGAGLYLLNGSGTLSAGWIGGNTAADRGGGLFLSQGSVTLSGGQIISNTAERGGGVYVDQGSATLSGGRILGNTATAAADSSDGGGGVYIDAGSAVFTQSGGRIEDNHGIRGGGVYAHYGRATLSGGQVVSNSATYGGGGVYVAAGTASLSGGQILSNTAGNIGGGVCVFGTNGVFTQTGVSTIAYNVASMSGGGVCVLLGQAALSGGLIHDNRANGTASSQGGGGLFVNVNSRLSVSGGQVISNTAGSGGGVYNNDGTLTLVNTTVSANSATGGSGGGLYANGGTTAITFTTIASNTASSGGYGIHSAGGAVRVHNTIVAYNGTTSTNCWGSITSNDYNLEYGDTCSFDQLNDIVDTNPNLDTLAYERGTLIHRLAETSPAINSGLCVDGITTDQRGVTRVPSCDIGSYEYVLQVYLPLVLRSY